ncbi:hypothetical protein K470DRAFT_294826 [Piedraia hortae CBS 480.64]|uniref:Uncharacterized protein n=1 Tax=Piedraia hortae CBS 480.64 TaxID=1314780 RepID=A0A6A7C190_9PEZI|nr:hypothetical protein K470DRAFT_294826 [Piedraia hortae CBS 480.64]
MHIAPLLLTLLLCLVPSNARKLFKGGHPRREKRPKHPPKDSPYGVLIDGYGERFCVGKRQAVDAYVFHGKCHSFVNDLEGPLVSFSAKMMKEWQTADYCRIWLYEFKKCKGRKYYAGEIGQMDQMCGDNELTSGFRAWSAMADCVNGGSPPSERYIHEGKNIKWW